MGFGETRFGKIGFGKMGFEPLISCRRGLCHRAEELDLGVFAQRIDGRGKRYGYIGVGLLHLYRTVRPVCGVASLWLEKTYCFYDNIY